jgi:hypothetical protein
MMASIPTVNDHFVNKHAAVRVLYDQLLNSNWLKDAYALAE